MSEIETKPLPVTPLDYADPARTDVLTPIVRTVGWVLLVWGTSDFVHYAMSFRSLEPGGDGWPYITTGLAMLSNLLLAIGGWQGVRRHPSTLRALIASEIAWIGVLLVGLTYYWDGWMAWLTEPALPDMPLTSHPKYMLAMSLLQSASPFISLVGALVVLRLPTLREYFREGAKADDSTL